MQVKCLPCLSAKCRHMRCFKFLERWNLTPPSLWNLTWAYEHQVLQSLAVFTSEWTHLTPGILKRNFRTYGMRPSLIVSSSNAAGLRSFLPNHIINSGDLGREGCHKFSLDLGISEVTQSTYAEITVRDKASSLAKSAMAGNASSARRWQEPSLRVRRLLEYKSVRSIRFFLVTPVKLLTSATSTTFKFS